MPASRTHLLPLETALSDAPAATSPRYECVKRSTAEPGAPGASPSPGHSPLTADRSLPPAEARRSPLIARDIDLLRVLAMRTTSRVSSSNFRTEMRTDLRTLANRCRVTIGGNRNAVPIAPMLPCDPAELIERAVTVTCGPIVPERVSRPRSQTIKRHDTRRGDRGLRSPRLERVAGSGVSALDTRSHGAARELQTAGNSVTDGRIRIACLRREHTAKPRRLIL